MREAVIFRKSMELQAQSGSPTRRSQNDSGRPDAAARERLLQAAVDAFATHGFEGTSLRQIARQAGVAFQLIGYHFGSKEQLWLATVDHLFAVRVRAAKTTFNPVKDFEQQLREWLRIALHFAIQEPQLRRIMCQELLAQSPRYGQHLKSRMEEAAPYFEYFFEQARKQGIVARLSTQEMLLVLRGILLLVAVAPDDVTALVGGPIDGDQTVGKLTDLVVNLFITDHGGSPLQPHERASE
jgi:AcrR family transcriptional regulator